MPGTQVGVYAGEETAGTEVSSTYEGRHLTVLETELIHPFRAGGFVNKGDPVVLCDAGVPGTYGRAVGVALSTATALTDYIALDTEGIWNLTVYAENDDGDVAIEIGDPLFIRAGELPGAADADGTGDGEISKIQDSHTQVPFGFALGSMVAGGSGVIAVKVHWDPELPVAKVGSHAVPEESAHADKIFREYRYRSTSTTGDVRGQYMELMLAGAGVSGEAGRNRTMIEAAVAVAHGCHDGIEFDTDGSVTGLAVGHRATYKAKNAAAAATIAGGMSELWADGDATDFATATVHSIHRFVVDGDVTGRATAQNAFEFANIPTGAGTGYMLDTGQNATASTDGIRCIINGAVYMILVASV